MITPDNVRKCIGDGLKGISFDERFNSKDTPKKRAWVKDLQDNLAKAFKSVGDSAPEVSLSGLCSDEPYSTFNDSADILVKGEEGEPLIIVEIDATRADQVAKKMFSRFAYAKKAGRKLIYVALLYPGTEAMNVHECQKYFVFGTDVLQGLGLGSGYFFIGGILKKQDDGKSAGIEYFESRSLMSAEARLLETLRVEKYKDYLSEGQIASKTFSNKMSGFYKLAEILQEKYSGEGPLKKLESTDYLIGEVDEIINMPNHDYESYHISKQSISSYKTYFRSYQAFLKDASKREDHHLRR